MYLRGEGFHSDRGERYSIFMRCEIIYEDDEMLTIYKPAGLATQSSSAWQADAVSGLKNYLSKKGISYLGVIHRLDQPVEGLLVFAKTPEAAAKLSKQLQQGTLNKKYLALVSAKPNPEEGELVEFDARVHFTGGAVVGLKKKLRVKVYDALSEEVLK